MNVRVIAMLVWAACFGSAAAAGVFGGGNPGSYRVPGLTAIAMSDAATYDPMPTMVPAFASAEPPSPTVTPLPPPIVPPPDASGISATTAPIGAVSPHPQPTVPDALWLTPGDKSTVQFELHGGRPYVPVVVNGVRREFLISTSEPSSLDESLLTGGNVEFYVLRTLQIGDVRFTRLRVTRARLAPYSQTYLGARADGLLGAAFFARYAATIDYPARTLTIYRNSAAADQAKSADAVILPVMVVGAAPAVTCAVDGTNASPCVVDIGLDSDLRLSPNFGEARRMLRAGPSLGAMHEASPDHEMAGRIVRALSLTIGAITINRPIAQLPDELRTDYEPPAAWTRIGNGVLGHFAITIDEPGGKFAISGSSGAEMTKSQFDRSGLWVVSRDGAVTVRSVDRGSPGEAAGLSRGDVVIAVDGRAATDLDAVRAQLIGAPGSKVAVTYQRGGRRHTVVIVLRTML